MSRLLSSRYKKISIGRDWFTDCPRAQIIVGKQVKAFSSKVNANAGSVRLLGNQTKLTGFKKPKGKNYYYIQFKKFIVPEKSKALPILRKARKATTAPSRKLSTPANRADCTEFTELWQMLSMCRKNM